MINLSNFAHNYTFHFAPMTSALVQRTATREAKLMSIYLSRWRELNPRPHPYQGCALPLSYIGVPYFSRAEDGAQTRGPQLGRLMLYRLSYFRNIAVGRGGLEPPNPKERIYSPPQLPLCDLPKEEYQRSRLEPLVGFEPTTPRLQITCSGQLS